LRVGQGDFTHRHGLVAQERPSNLRPRRDVGLPVDDGFLFEKGRGDWSLALRIGLDALERSGDDGIVHGWEIS
jgi:hypothetical protein